MKTDIVYDEYKGIDICFLEKDGYVIELVSPKTKTSVVSNLLSKLGNSPYHICYETENLDQTINNLKGNGFVQWEEPHEAVALGCRRVCFLISPFSGMIELVEESENSI